MSQQYVMEAGYSQQVALLYKMDFRKYRQTHPIYKLNADCWDNVLDWLPLGDVLSFGQTCRDFKRVAGTYFQSKYSAKTVSSVLDLQEKHPLKDFIEYSQRAQLCHQSITHLSDWNALKHLELNDVILTKSDIILIKHILHKIETISITSLTVDEDNIECDVYLDLLKHCSHLKSLHIDGCWPQLMFECLQQKYPDTLRQLDISYFHDKLQLDRFFHFNPNVRNLNMSPNCIWKSRHSLVKSNIKVNELTIDYKATHKTSREMCVILNELYAHGFYKQLHCFINPYKSNNTPLATLHGLVTLDIQYKGGIEFELPPLPSLEELSFHHCLTYVDNEPLLNVITIPNMCINLQRLIIDVASVVEILPFIRHSPNLREVIIIRWKENVLDLSALNRERKRLNGAKKVTIYVSENVYLETKWRRMKKNLSLIEMQRLDSYKNKLSDNFKSLLQRQEKVENKFDKCVY